MPYTQIECHVADGIMTITLDRPEKLNAFTDVMRAELLAAFDEADANDAVRAVIMTGRGRAFCAGADLSGGARTFDMSARGGPSDIAAYRDGGGQVSLRIFDLKKPIIAAINGPAVGVGITMTLPMDMRLASESARIGFVFTRRGIVMEACSSWFLPRIVGPQQATEWVFSGRVFSAQDALAGRLVRSVHAPDELLPAARAIAREIADNTSGASVALNRQLIWRGLAAPHPMHAHMADSRGILEMGKSADVAEGVLSFKEKRAPHFTMSVANELPDLFPSYEPPAFR